MKRKKLYTDMKLQHHSGRYTLTIPVWMAEQVLEAYRGDIIHFDFKGDKLILSKKWDKH